MPAGKHRADTPLQAMLKRFLPPLLLLGGVGIFVTAFLVSNTSDNSVASVTGNPAVEALTPPPGSEVLRQSQVGIDLAAGYEAELTINDVPIPLDEINILRSTENPDESAEVAGVFDTTISRFLYQPLEGRSVPELKADENCAVAQFWPIADPDNIDTVRWCFTVA